jgi:hypothetical protein
MRLAATSMGGKNGLIPGTRVISILRDKRRQVSDQRAGTLTGEEEL